MDMALRDAVLSRPGEAARTGGGCRSRRAMDAVRDATQATMMMALVWPAIVCMPFFWAPPLWVLAGMRTRGGK